MKKQKKVATKLESIESFLKKLEETGTKRVLFYHAQAVLPIFSIPIGIATYKFVHGGVLYFLTISGQSILFEPLGPFDEQEIEFIAGTISISDNLESGGESFLTYLHGDDSQPIWLEEIKKVPMERRKLTYVKDETLCAFSFSDGENFINFFISDTVLIESKLKEVSKNFLEKNIKNISKEYFEGKQIMAGF